MGKMTVWLRDDYCAVKRRGVLLAEKRLEVAPPMHGTKYKHVFALDEVNDYVFVNREAAVSGAEIFLP